MLICRPGLSQRRKEPKTKQQQCQCLHKLSQRRKETKAAISISTQTVTEAEQPKPVAVAPVQKKKSKSKSVRIVTDEDVAGPSHPAEETEPEIITRSLSLGELRDLRREFTHQTNESILTWLLRIWDAAANDTILDGSEARQLGSLSRDVVIDQGIGRTQQTLSLWRRLLTSVRDRDLCKEDLQVHQGKWSTMEKGIRCLGELAVLEIIFSEDERFPKSPDDVQCTSQMWLRFARLGPEMYSRYLATLQWREGEDKVGVLVNKLRIYEDTVTAPFHTHVSSVETRLAEQVWSLIEEGHQKLKKELKEEIYHISPEPTRVSAIRSRNSVIPIHEMIRKLESQGVVSKVRPPFSSPIWPVHKSSGEWRLTVDYRALNEVTPPLSAAVPDMLELQYELESKAAKCPTICHGLIQTALEKDEAPEHLQYIDDIIVWGNTAGEVFKKGEKIIQILLKAGFAIKRSTNWKWKAAVWSPTRRVAQATEGQGGSSQVAELKAIQLALDIARREKWPRLYLYTDSWMVANALWGWLNRWKKANWQRRGKPIWAAEIWQDIAARVEKLTVKVRHVDAHVSKGRANESITTTSRWTKPPK
ncbi:hypothetical protein DUI87_35539 [Hirundo rustica rustica]|uniref:RNase H type-1 domain-containing protein n=1 Tax=Hirundo rustica rustica TaxID=333673 RepID=A0A3M0IIF7_HIRRU|nr:hypothetical protein DUI87_35539 [Hirundo rustica rustica]